MEATEITRNRKLLGQSIEQLADDLGVSPSTVIEWETGDRKVPSKYARHIDWFAAVAERAAVLAQSGLPECEWVTRFDREEPLADVDKELERLQALEVHQRQCATCRARTAYLDARLPPLPPFPTSRWNRAVIWALDRYDSLGGRRRGLGVALSVPLLLAIGWVLHLAPRSWPFEIVTYIVALTLAVVSGIGAYRGLRLLRGFGAIGRWFSRSFAGIIAMVGFGAVFTLANFGSTLSSDGVALGWGEIITIGVIAGVAYATIWPFASAAYNK